MTQNCQNHLAKGGKGGFEEVHKKKILRSEQTAQQQHQQRQHLSSAHILFPPPLEHSAYNNIT